MHIFRHLNVSLWTHLQAHVHLQGHTQMQTHTQSYMLTHTRTQWLIHLLIHSHVHPNTNLNDTVFTGKISRLSYESPRTILLKMLDGTAATLRTNFFNDDRYALSLRVRSLLSSLCSVLFYLLYYILLCSIVFCSYQLCSRSKAPLLTIDKSTF